MNLKLNGNVAQNTLALLLIAFVALITRNAWLSDDAYITFRSIDNLLNGHGMRWNVGERVQAFTHPLWMLVLAASTAVTREFSLTPLVVSVAISSTAVAILTFRVIQDRGAAIVAMSILCLAKSFVDYSTSGLENPLNHLLLVLFAWVYFGRDRAQDATGASSRSPERRLFLCFAIAGLAGLNRMDTALLYAPALLTELLAQRNARALGLATLALAPLLLWESFAIFYYGFPFPNTAYAKLGSGVSATALASQGLLYLRASFVIDPLTSVTIAAGCVIAAARRERGSALVLGILLYLVYVVRIGGDFMAGRHLALPLLAAVILLCRALPRSPSVVALALATALALAVASPHTTLAGDGWIHRGDAIPELHGVKDERAVYAPYTAVFSGFPLREHPWKQQGLRAAAGGRQVIPRAAIGLFGFYAGPGVWVVDANGLADPLLARLPARELGESGWRIGHHARDLPDGYVESLREGSNQIVNLELRSLYDSLVLVTRGELWSSERLREIGKQLTR